MNKIVEMVSGNRNHRIVAGVRYLLSKGEISRRIPLFFLCSRLLRIFPELVSRNGVVFALLKYSLGSLVKV
jgi:hypothetical protein